MGVFLDMLSYRKGDASKYRPTPGTICEISGPNCDNDAGYTYVVGEVLWTNETFIVWRIRDCWPNVNKWEHIRSRPLPADAPAHTWRFSDPAFTQSFA